ncbi:sensor histidine kinase [Amphibacillus sp. Q70]|uniref:sensor histidine kinase n=1 Tax=Amphibacillus sp. Q70 TaxID=3453416 RepID=UPI003F863D46
MWRNREIRILLLVMSTVGLVSVVAVYTFPSAAVMLVLLTALLLISCVFVFTHWRYREIEKLSDYLKKISNGDYSLDVRDNHEGELSILKNDIYKVTLMLSEQSLLLQKDKVRLTDAISDISHQLKTPLTSMTVMADLLEDVDLPDLKRIEFIQNIHTQLERIDWLVSSLLKLSKIDAGTTVFKQEPVIVKELIQKALDPVLIPIDVKEQSISIKGEENVSFIGDFNWTVEALINILKNCVEHTQQGGKIEISFSKNVLFTEIVIVDNGKGIPKEDLPYIFNRFYKGKGGSEESIGIGLAMAYSIVTNQHGDIEVKSEQGQGTTFQIKFYHR